MLVAGPLAPGSELLLPPAQSHHLTHVLRAREGDRIAVFDGEGGEYEAVVTQAQRQGAKVRLETARAIECESPLAVTLVQGVSRGERMDYTIQKAVELGVARIDPVLTRRSVVRLDAERATHRLARWRAVAAGACEQCGRARVPPVSPPLALEDWLARARVAGAAGARLLPDPGAALGLRDVAPSAGAATLIVGPEGGLTEAERAAALAAGFVAVRLGPRVLRTETAALAALAAMQALWGDF